MHDYKKSIECLVEAESICDRVNLGDDNYVKSNLIDAIKADLYCSMMEAYFNLQKPIEANKTHEKLKSLAKEHDLKRQIDLADLLMSIHDKSNQQTFDL